MRTRIRENKYTGSVTAEADSPDAAIDELSRKLGPGARIEAVRTVRLGGVAGFFARERYEVRARRGRPAAAAPEPAVIEDAAPAVVAPIDEQVPSGFSAALSAALFGPDAEAEAESRGGVAVLVADDPVPRPVGPLAGGRRLPGAEPIARSPGDLGGDVLDEMGIRHLDEEDPAASSGSPSWRIAEPAGPAAPGTGRVAWSTAALHRNGVPKVLAAAADGIDERDDLGWINAIADAVARHCGPLPDGPTVFAGSGTEAIAAALDVPVVKVGARSVPEGSFATNVPDEPAALAWLSAVLRDRLLHVVVGDAPWMHLLVADPSGVSYAGDPAVVDALYVALTLGAPLGFGVDPTGAAVRLTPIETALTVRRLVGRR